MIINPPRVSALATYLSEISRTPLLSAQEEKELACRILECDASARDHMIRANLRLVVNIARSFLAPGLGLDDLIEEGNLGLIRAIEGFDPTMNTRFSTYAAYWIKQSINRFICSARALPLPSYVVQLLREWWRESVRLEARIGRPPSDEEINSSLKLSARKLHNVKRARQVLMSKGNEAIGSLSDLNQLVARTTIDHEDRSATVELLERALHLLDGLDERESHVLRMRFGLKGEEPMTLAQIGSCLGLTRERIRQIQKDALMKLNQKMRTLLSHEV